jgi:hypothetical protein
MNMKKHESPYYTTPGQGQKQLLDERDGCRIEREILSGRACDISDLGKSLQLPCSDSTLRRALYKMGMHGGLCRKKPYLKLVHVCKRKAWACKFQKWTPFQWHIVWFSDESKYKLFGSDGKIYCWRRVGEEFHPRNTIPTVKGSTGKVNVWGVILYHGVGQLHCVVGNMDSEQLEGILEDSLLHSFDDHRTDPTYPFYAMDNDPKHSSR